MPELSRKRGPKAWCLRTGRLLWLSIRRYFARQGSLRAGGLTYLTLMSLIPGLTVVLLIASAFGVKQQFRDWVDAQSGDWTKQLVEIKDAVLNVVDHVQVELLGAFGLLLFVWVVMSLLTKVEKALNATWNAGKARTLARRYADYVAILFLVPLLVLAATGLKTVVAFDAIVDAVPFLDRIVESGLSLLPFAMIWLALTLVYKVMPNVRVLWGAAALAGLLAGASWYVAQSLFLQLQIGISRSNAIYGSLALLPFLLFYLHLSWSIVLWGAEFCYVYQNRLYLQSSAVESLWTPARRRRLALALFRGALDQFKDGKSLRLSDFAGFYRWPRQKVDEIAAILVDHGLMHRVQHGQAVIPARPPGQTPVKDLLQAIDGPQDDPPHGDTLSSRPLAAADERILEELRRCMTAVDGML